MNAKKCVPEMLSANPLNTCWSRDTTTYCYVIRGEVITSSNYVINISEYPELTVSRDHEQ